MSGPVRRQRPLRPSATSQWRFRTAGERAAVIGGALAVALACVIGVWIGSSAGVSQGIRAGAPATPVVPDELAGGDGGTDAPGTGGRDGGAANPDGSPIGGDSSPKPTTPHSTAPSVPPGAGPSTPPTTVPPPATPAPRAPDDPMSPAYNPYLVPGDPAFVTEAARTQWLGQQEVARQCMRDAGFEYLQWAWWEDGNPMPEGLSPGAQQAWLDAFRGEGGCEGVATEVAREADAAGTPLSAPLPERDPALPTPRERWLAFQDEVRACMAAAGLEYGYWEYWNPAYPATDGSPAMPPGLDDAQRANWNLTAFGAEADPGPAVPTEGGGCWATGAEASHFRPFA